MASKNQKVTSWGRMYGKAVVYKAKNTTDGLARREGVLFVK